MTDNDPAATAALAERVAELDRLFPRREETTGRAMCAGWGPSVRTPITGPGHEVDSEVMPRGGVHERWPSGHTRPLMINDAPGLRGAVGDPWLVVDLKTDRKLGLVWPSRPSSTVVVEDERYFAVRLKRGKGITPVAYVDPAALEDAKRRVRRDVASVTT